MTGARRRLRWLGLPMLGLAIVVGLSSGAAYAQDDDPSFHFPPEDQQPASPPGLPPPPDGTPLQDDPLEPIGPPEEPGLFDIPGQVNSAIHGFLADLVETGLRIVVELLSETILATPDLTGHEHIRALWTAMAIIANAVFVLFVVAGGFVISARETLQTQYGLKEIVPRIVVAGLAANLSLLLVGQAISFANAFTLGVARDAVPAGAGAAFAQTWDEAALLTGTNVISLLLGLVLVVLALVVLVTYIVRVAVMVVLIISAPVVLLFHALPQTERLAFLWWRALAGCFVIQAGQTLVLVAAIGVFLFPFGSTVLGVPTSGSGWLALLVAVTMLWLMIKIPVWVKQYLWMNSRGVFRQLLVAYFLFRTVSAATGRAGTGRGRPRAGGSGPKPSGSRSGPGSGPTGRPRPGGRPNPTGGPRTGPGPLAGARRRPTPPQPQPAGARNVPTQPTGTRPASRSRPGPVPPPQTPPGPNRPPTPAPAPSRPLPAPARDPHPQPIGDPVPPRPAPTASAGRPSFEASAGPATSGEPQGQAAEGAKRPQRAARPLPARPDQPIRLARPARTPQPAPPRPAAGGRPAPGGASSRGPAPSRPAAGRSTPAPEASPLRSRRQARQSTGPRTTPSQPPRRPRNRR